MVEQRKLTPFIRLGHSFSSAQLDFDGGELSALGDLPWSSSADVRIAFQKAMLRCSVKVLVSKTLERTRWREIPMKLRLSISASASSPFSREDDSVLVSSLTWPALDQQSRV